MSDPTPAPVRVLFLCTHNAARSQMAAALLRRYGGDRFVVRSAGTAPAARVHPLAEAALREVGLSLAGQEPAHLDRYRDQPWGYVIAVCDADTEACPALPGDPARIRWAFEDPAAVTGTEAERLLAFRRVREELRRRVQLLVALPAHRGGGGGA